MIFSNKQMYINKIVSLSWKNLKLKVNLHKVKNPSHKDYRSIFKKRLLLKLNKNHKSKMKMKSMRINKLLINLPVLLRVYTLTNQKTNYGGTYLKGRE